MRKPKYIDADRLIRRLENRTYRAKGKFIEMINDQPAADVVEVVRCKDCKYGDTGTDEIGRQFYKCIGIHYGSVSPTDYCSYGERKDE